MRALALVLCGTLAAAPGPQAFTLPSGLRCVLLEKHDQPLIRVDLTVRWAPDPGPSAFLASLLAGGGAGPYTRAEFNRALDDLGATFEFEGKRHVYRWTLVTDSRSQEPAMELLAHAVFRPVFDASTVEVQRVALLQQQAAESPWDRARARFLWNLGDEGTVTGPPKDADFAALQTLRRRVVRPENAILVLAGDLSLTQAKDLVFLHFGLWGPGALPPPGSPAAPAAAEPKLLAVPEGGPDAELWAGRDSSGCEPAVRELLAGLLEQVPRVLSPGIVSEASLGSGQPLLVKVKAGAQGREGLVAAFQETLAALRRGFSQQDLERVRTRWKARTAALPLHPEDQVRRFQEGVLDPDFLRKVDAVTLKDLDGALGALLAPGSLRFLLLGGDAFLVRRAGEAGLGPAKMLD